MLEVTAREARSVARILHVDDDETWRRLIKSRLVDHYVDSAESLQEAITLLQRESEYDLALVDLNLASDSDRQGGDLLDLMRIRYPATRRILVTGSPPAGSVRKNVFERYDVEEIIIKSTTDMPDLRRVVEEAIAQGSDRLSQSLRLSRSALRQRFREWERTQGDLLIDEMRAAEGRMRDAEQAGGRGRFRTQVAADAVAQRNAEFRLVCDRLHDLLENIENEEQFNAALAALSAAEQHFAEPQRGLGRALPWQEPADESSRSGDSRSLPEPDPEELRASAGAKAADYGIGDVIDHRFEIIDVLGQGGFSRVYRVRDDVEGEERALKLFDSAVGYAAVRREIGALRKIRHPNVVEVFWAGKTPAGDWYLITEFIDGESLNSYVNGRLHIDDREAVNVALDVLAALVAFHPDAARLKELDARRREGDLSEAELYEWLELKDKGLVHRDIKPHNVMLTRTGAKLLDFNIASRVGDPVHTQSGTPPYRPPDADLTHWDVSTDLFAVGVLLYQLLCNGHHPYPHAMPMLDQPVIDPRTIRPDLSPRLAEFLIKACAPSSADRFATAAEMLTALRNIRADQWPSRSGMIDT
jgi:CheY-like chemotaxis protein